MKVTLDTQAKHVIVADGDVGMSKTFDLYSKESFELLAKLWLKVGWNEKHVYTFSWLGRPIIQLPEDMLRIQEVIYRVKPDVIVETGVAHGGSLIYYATLCKAIGKGRVVGIDIDIRPHNRLAIENHVLASLITLIEGSSTDQTIVDQVHQNVEGAGTVLVILDSCHSKKHVAAELELYADFVTKGSYLIVADGSMKDLHDTPRGSASWKESNPYAAVQEFIAHHKEFVIDIPAWEFNESNIKESFSSVFTHYPAGYLKRVAS